MCGCMASLSVSCFLFEMTLRWTFLDLASHGAAWIIHRCTSVRLEELAVGVDEEETSR